MLPPPQQSLPCSARFVGGAAAGERTERIRGLWRGLNGGCRTKASACLAQLGWSALGRLPSRLSAREHAASHLEGVGAIKVAVGDRHEYACRESLDPFIRPPVRIGRRTALFASEAVKGAGGADGPFPRSAHLPIHRVHARRGGAWKESGTRESGAEASIRIRQPWTEGNRLSVHMDGRAKVAVISESARLGPKRSILLTHEIRVPVMRLGVIPDTEHGGLIILLLRCLRRLWESRAIWVPQALLQ